MKRIGLLGAVVALVALTAGGEPAARREAPGAKKGDTGGLVHVVFFTMKKDAPKGAVEEVIADCHKVLGKIPAVRSVRAGRPSPKGEKLAQKDYDVGLLILVDDADGLQAYLEHPLHVEFVKKHIKHFDIKRLRIFDFIDEKK
jgi:hypothetical protein